MVAPLQHLVAFAFFASAAFASLLPAPALAQQSRGAQAQIPGRQAGETMQCRIEDVAPSQRATARASGDARCALDAARLGSVVDKPGAVVVDVRPQSAQEHGRIPGAFVTSVAELRHQTALRKSPLLLIGDGKDDPSLLEQCSFLKANGFANVSVLRGGIVSWVGSQRPLIAQPAVLSNLQRLTDTELLQASLRGDKLILLTPSAKSFAPLIKNAVQMPSQEPAQIAAALKQPRARQKFDSAILVTGAPLSDLELKAAAAGSPATPFNYAGNAKAFENFLRTQIAIWKRAEGGQRIRCPGL